MLRGSSEAAFSVAVECVRRSAVDCSNSWTQALAAIERVDEASTLPSLDACKGMCEQVNHGLPRGIMLMDARSKPRSHDLCLVELFQAKREALLTTSFTKCVSEGEVP